MPETRAPVGERQQPWDSAYGFMASKALFAALELDLFTELAEGPCTCPELIGRGRQKTEAILARKGASR